MTYKSEAIVSPGKKNATSQNIRLEATSGRIIWFNISQQNTGLDKMPQCPVQLNLKSIQCCPIHHFPVKIIVMADCFHCEKLSSCVQPETSQEQLLLMAYHLFHVILEKRVSMFFEATL